MMAARSEGNGSPDAAMAGSGFGGWVTRCIAICKRPLLSKGNRPATSRYITVPSEYTSERAST